MTRKDPIEIATTASYLYDGGWRATDREMILEEYGSEYGLTAEDADAICAELARIEDAEERRGEEEALDAWEKGREAAWDAYEAQQEDSYP